jgi:outer membrane immunogenic protein
VSINRLTVLTLLAGLFVTSASAEEISRAPRAVPQGSANWTGFYIGANAGYGFNGNTAAAYTPNDPNVFLSTCGFEGCPTSSPLSFKGGMVGGQLGYNSQLNEKWLVGIEADYDFANLRGNGTSTFLLASSGTATATAGININSLGSLKARIGYLPTNSLLLYGTGGLAFGKISTDASIVADGGFIRSGFGYFCNSAAPTCFAGSSSKTSVGWTAGGGAEIALTDHFTAKLEYTYVDLGKVNGLAAVATDPIGNTPSSFAVDAAARFSVVRMGLNYHFE